AGPTGRVQVGPGQAGAFCASPPPEVAERLRAAASVAIVWSQDAPDGGRAVAALAASLPGEVALYVLPRTPNGPGVASAWYGAGSGRGSDPPEEGEIGALVISGDEAVYDPRVLELAARARFVLTTAMFMGEHTLLSHLVVPGSSYLERDGTTVNLEGRRQRQRRAVTPPAGWDELEFFARLAERFGVAVSPWAELLPAEQAELEPRGERRPIEAKQPLSPPTPPGSGFELVRYRPLFSGPAVERIEELEFQRPAAEVELAWEDAEARGIATGDLVSVQSNGTSRELRARVNRQLLPGVTRIADEFAEGLEAPLSIKPVAKRRA
ncbi:MAG TPA: molybdopterin dinucleotide binding domain-containing protein, partial [Gaiellaceae bacterium]|nr:molybdopterin dinucleotide binding domain-containing protein [Gaiellaceae bacterium]